MSDYQKSYEKALELWDGLEGVIKEEPFGETSKCPMHPYHYFQLSQVYNFKVINGNTYTEYLEKWRSRKNY